MGEETAVFCIFFVVVILSGVRLSPLSAAAPIILLYQPRMIADGDIATIGGM
jgi:hypothetical protein